jgi:hypothetical protein
VLGCANKMQYYALCRAQIMKNKCETSQALNTKNAYLLALINYYLSILIFIENVCVCVCVCVCERERESECWSECVFTFYFYL